MEITPENEFIPSSQWTPVNHFLPTLESSARLHALNFAVIYHRGFRSSSQTVLETAKEFEEYINTGKIN